ncbi:glycoside hydrolase family 2 TIM barrel-domain containing protein [Paenibacillus xylanexedens]|uniref:glycoside hydrolase family 2 TIM barrel-domain containing protein n=1 Tax=Paenibacillus xylanexedens TaxID=528191 RepID=UPI0021B61391|nr:glycoside hydrolase family 2 TIM barrel-domain containing protein [Paenibacillus xylanexedens]
MNVKRLFNEGWQFAKSDLSVAKLTEPYTGTENIEDVNFTEQTNHTEPTDHIDPINAIDSTELANFTDLPNSTDPTVDTELTKPIDLTKLSFEAVELPHDWLIYNTLDLYENSIGWYRKTFHYVKHDQQQVILCFDGVYMDSSVYVNGQFVGEWKYGYSAFEHEITNALLDGVNEILVKVVHQSPNSRWYSGAGIYRNVWLKTRSRNHIVTDGIYVSMRQQPDGWQVEVDTELCLEQNQRAQLIHTILYKGEVIAFSQAEIVADAATGTDRGTNLTSANTNTSTDISAMGDADERAKAHERAKVHAQPIQFTNSQQLNVLNPNLWSPDVPHLYDLVTELRLISEEQPEEVIESIPQRIGFKQVRLDASEGFYLNDVKMKLNGVCEHHDLGALGSAFNVTAMRRRFVLLKKMGVNAIRTAHNMPAKEFMELADEMGMLVVSEAFDMWERAKTPYDYARFFTEWAHADVRSWVRRDRNHVSLIMWSIGNEIYDTHADERGQEVTRMLMEYVQEFDPKGNARVTIGSNYMPWENAQKCADIVKLAGYNYAEKYYDQHHAEHPDWIIYGSETSSVVQSRGIYHFPYEQPVLDDDDEQCSALGNSTTSWGAKSPEYCIIAERDHPFSLGQFLWTGFDYIGEPTPYHTKNSYFGQLDTATFPKDSYYIYQAAWTDYKKSPMVHLFPYWDFSPGQIIDVRVCSNAPKIELQLNGETIGTYDIDHAHGTQLSGWWKVPFEEGELKAIAYDEHGTVIATDEQRSFTDAKKVRLLGDRQELQANGKDLIFVEISVEDEAGHPVHNANNRVQVKVSGAGRLLGLDNGDSTDYDPYKGLSRRLFSGKLMAIIGSTHEAGTIQIEVFSEGLEGATATFESKVVDEGRKSITAGNHREGRERGRGLHVYADSAPGWNPQQPVFMKNEKRPVLTGNAQEIPLRKIEIISESGQILDASNPEVMVTAKLYPEDTTYRDVQWSVVNDAGIVSNIAKVEVIASGTGDEPGSQSVDVDEKRHRVRVSAMGDGAFRLRATSNNGTDKPKLISQLEFKAEGLGTAYKDPYGFISGGLYDYTKGDVGNGNERGVATSRDSETHVGFRNIDFGPYGSDTITIPIFALSSETYFIQIWEGMPGEEGSVMIADVIYDKESIWNVYQEETYRLSKRLSGITSICFVLKQKIHIKGFSFERQSRAFETNAAASCDHLYGDTFTIEDDRVAGIGNNVSLEFEQMNFTSKGTSKLVIYGASAIDKNTIHIRFAGVNGQSNQLVEFTQSEGYEERTFELEPVYGEQKVTFIFLPGSQFDFGWFRFEKE